MAQRKASRKDLPRRSGGYHFEGDSDNAPVQELRAAFLDCITRKHRQVLADLLELGPLAASLNTALAAADRAADRKHYGLTWAYLEAVATEADSPLQVQATPPHDLFDAASLHKALASWAKKYHLAAPWVMESAVHSLGRIANASEPPALTLAPAMFEAFTPPRFTFAPQPISPTEGLEAYRTRLDHDFAEARSEHLKALTAHLADLRDLVPARAIDRRTRRAVRVAVRWQVTGEYSGNSDIRTARQVLERVGLTPPEDAKGTP